MKGLKELRDVVRLLGAMEATRGWVSPLPSEQIFQKAVLRRRKELMDACVHLWDDRRPSRNGKPRMTEPAQERANQEERETYLRFLYRQAVGEDSPARGLRASPSDDLPDSVKELRIVCSAPPSHVNPEFIELEDEDGKSIGVGVWRERDDGLWELAIDTERLGIWT